MAKVITAPTQAMLTAGAAAVAAGASQGAVTAAVLAAAGAAGATASAVAAVPGTRAGNAHLQYMAGHRAGKYTTLGADGTYGPQATAKRQPDGSYVALAQCKAGVKLASKAHANDGAAPRYSVVAKLGAAATAKATARAAAKAQAPTVEQPATDTGAASATALRAHGVANGLAVAHAGPDGYCVTKGGAQHTPPTATDITPPTAC